MAELPPIPCPGTDFELRLKACLLRGMHGDQAAYETFLTEAATILRRYLERSIPFSSRTQERIEDLLQDVLLSIHNKCGSFRTDLPVLPWLYAIARYRLIDSLRSETRQSKTKWRVPLDDFHVDSHAFRDWDHREARERNSPDAHQLLDHLSSNQREVLLLAKVEELSLPEVAKKMQLSLSAVKVTVHRAVRTLRSRSGRVQ